jgi:hypothetical protein
MVIDGAVTLRGSHNWTRGAAANSENVNLVPFQAQRRTPEGLNRRELAEMALRAIIEDWREQSRRQDGYG